jgi:hypothetical protein
VDLINNLSSMLPVAYQTPAAALLLIGGVLACLAGYRLFKLVLGIYGFILGALMASSAVGSAETWLMIVAAIGGGLAGALILVAAYFVGVALIGAALAALAVNLIWSRIGHDPHVLVVVVAAAAGALGALALQRYVIIVGTAFGGAWTAIVGGLGMRADASKSPGEVWLAYPASLGEHRALIVALWIACSLVGVIVQFSVTGRGRRGGSRARRKQENKGKDD